MTRSIRFFLTFFVFIQTAKAFAQDYPPELELGEMGILSASDYHEPLHYLPADVQEVCLQPNALYEFRAVAYNLNLLIYLHDKAPNVTRDTAWNSARAREVTDGLGMLSGTHYLADLQFRVPPSSDGRCRRFYAVVSVSDMSPTYYGRYRVRLLRL